MIAILSDVHGNLEALSSVLKDIQDHPVDDIVCLGDLVGYGPDSYRCLEIAMDWSMVLRGDMDDALISDPATLDMPDQLKQMVAEVRTQIVSQGDNSHLFDFVENLPLVSKTNTCQLVHASLRDPLNEYVFPEHVHDGVTMRGVFQPIGQLCFCGHTHLAGVIEQTSDSTWMHMSDRQCNYKFRVREHKVLCNVGSVGQPRDTDPRASYVLYEPPVIRFRRVPYDIELTRRKIRDNGDDDMHGTRLTYGR